MPYSRYIETELEIKANELAIEVYELTIEALVNIVKQGAKEKATVEEREFLLAAAELLLREDYLKPASRGGICARPKPTQELD